MDEKKQTPQARYDARTARPVYLKLNKVTDADILKKLETVGSIQGYIKRLIRADIEKEDIEMKEMQFTTRELETLVWALNNQMNEKMRRNSESGKPMKDEQVERIGGMLNRAFMLMHEAHKEEN